MRSNYEEIRREIAREVGQLAQSGNRVGVDRLALDLSTRFPQSGLTLGEIRELIRKARARASRAPISG